MFEGMEPLDLALAAHLTVRLASRLQHRERAGRLCDQLVGELAYLSEVESQGWQVDVHRINAATALTQLETAGLN
jgi:hypothetical protein